MIYIKLILIATVIGVYNNSKVRQENRDLQPNSLDVTPSTSELPSHLIPMIPLPMEQPSQPQSFCPVFDKCLFYQVNQNFTDYGCTVCEKEYMVVSSLTGAGKCTQINNIKFCKGAQKRPDLMDNEPFCFQCEQNYVLKNDSYSCIPIQEHQKIENCMDYYMNKTEIFCNVCSKGYTLDESRKKCEEGCRINNCESCSIVNGSYQCFACSPGTIGVYDNSTYIYKKCLNCNEYEYNLQIMNSTYIPRD